MIPEGSSKVPHQTAQACWLIWVINVCVKNSLAHGKSQERCGPIWVCMHCGYVQFYKVKIFSVVAYKGIQKDIFHYFSMKPCCGYLLEAPQLMSIHVFMETMMIWYFTFLSTLFKSYQDNGRVIIKCFVQ